MLTHLSLFSGIGGIDIAAEWAGFTTVAFVEIDPFCQKVLKKHWPDVPIIGDIRDVTREKIVAYAEGQRQREQAKQTDTSGIRGTPRLGVEICGVCARSVPRVEDGKPAVDLITGGFPCQPFSVAGKRRGKDDDRYLWPEMLAVVASIRPTWVVGENVAGFASMVQYDSYPPVEDAGVAIGEVGDTHVSLGRGVCDEAMETLEALGYTVQPFLIPACGVDAQHKRDRVLIVGHAQCAKWRQSESNRYDQANDADTERGVRNWGTDESEWRQEGREVAGRGSWWAVEPRLGGMVDGFSVWMDEPDISRVAKGVLDRVNRLRALGNAVVPQQIYPILKAIANTYEIYSERVVL